MVGALFLHFSAFNAFASENAFWHEYDLVLKWVNFFIVIVLIVKFAGKPLMDFFKGRNKVKVIEISRLEAEKEKISGEFGETLMIINEKKTLLADAENNISSQGESIKAEIIREAGIESELILEKAKQEAEKEIKQATENLRTEVINEVFDKLPGAKQD
jgi:F-type H+-transporting ATPase subunit b